MWRIIILATLATLPIGCATGPLQENPLLVGGPRIEQENPVYLPQSPWVYKQVFTKIQDILSDYFVIVEAQPYDGRIVTAHSIAPGCEQPWKPGSPDSYQRLLAFCQSIRHRAVVVITSAESGGYFVDVKVFKELEDLPNPTRSTSGNAGYRLESTVGQQFQLIEPETTNNSWIPIGRDCPLEQVILSRIASMDLSCPPPS
jgi:hypothetical protein